MKFRFKILSTTHLQHMIAVKANTAFQAISLGSDDRQADTNIGDTKPAPADRVLPKVSEENQQSNECNYSSIYYFMLYKYYVPTALYTEEYRGAESEQEQK